MTHPGASSALTQLIVPTIHTSITAHRWRTIMNHIRPCILGCRNPENIPYRAAPGRMVCDRCTDKLAATLTAIATTYAQLQTVAELTPGGHGHTGTRRPPGPRSPAVDGLIVHGDPRSTWDGQPAALATVESWARMVREERAAAAPAGRVTMRRELDTLRFHWDWLLGQPWVDEFAGEMRRVLAALKAAGRLTPPALRIGTCPAVLTILHFSGGRVIDFLCGATLRVRVGDTDIRCRNCGTIWPRSRWRDELGDRWADYASLSADLGVKVDTLRYWCSKDQWAVSGGPRRRLVSRADALTSFERWRGPLPFDQAG
jgi:hypothetical protein